MAGVNEIQAPSVQPEAQPVVTTPEPPRGAFSGAHVGAGLGKIGEELFGVGSQAYFHAAEAHAQEKETEFQTRALKLRDQYRSLYNMDAISTHDKFTKALNDARQEIEGTLNSKHGERLYRNNSLRNMRLIQESIDSHFEQQNKSYQFGEHLKGQRIDLEAVAKFAADGNLKAVNEKIEMMQEKTADFAGSHGLDPDTESSIITSKAAHAAVKTALDQHSSISKELYAKWGDKLDASYQAVAQRTLMSQGVADEVEHDLVNLPRIDADGKTNPRGAIDAEAFRKLTDSKSADERGEKVRDLLQREAGRIAAQHKAAGEQMESRVVRLGQGRGPSGTFAVPENTAEWQEFKTLYPMLADHLIDKSHSNLRKAVTEGRADEAHRGREAYGRAASRLYDASTEELKQITPQSIESQMRGDGAREQDIERGKAKLAKLQKAGPDHTGREIPTIAREVLNSVNPRFAKTNQWQAIEYLDSLHEQHPDMSRSQLGKDLNDHIVKGFFGRAKLETPQQTPQPTKAQQSNPPPGKYRKPDGSVGTWDGAKWLP